MAEFIFGGNSKEDKIEMTSPVTTESGSKAKGKGEKIDMTTPVTTEMAAGRQDEATSALLITTLALKLLFASCIVY